jgi:hypothetical protein
MSRLKILAFGLFLTFTVGCDNTRNTPPIPSFLEDGTQCATLSPEACVAHKSCLFQHADKTCAEAQKKNVCENIQSPEACTHDQSCGGWDQGTQKCLEKQGTSKEKIVKLFNIHRVNTHPIDSLTVSENQEWAYFVSNNHKSLTAFNIQSPQELKANLANNNKWVLLDLETKLADDAAGRANLSGSTTVVHQVASKKGALVSLGGPQELRGVALLEGAHYVAAWKNNKEPNFLGLVMSKTTGEHYASIFASLVDNKFIGSTNNVNINKLSSFAEAQVKLDLSIDREINNFTSMPWSAPGYLIDNSGITLVADNQVAANVKHPVIDTKNLDLSAESWRFLNTPGKDNNNVSGVALVKNILFIALKSDGKPETGGVAVYDPKAEANKRVIRPHESWAKTSVIALAPDKHGTVWAVTPNALIEVLLTKKSVKQGQKIDTDEIARSVLSGDHEKDKTPGLKFSQSMTLEALTGAHWIGDHLIITSKNGIHVWLYELRVSK